MNLRMFNKVIMSNIHYWIQIHMENDYGPVPEILIKVKTKFSHQLKLNGFSKEEIDDLKEIESSPDFIGTSDKPISYLMHSLLVLKYWVEDIPKEKRPFLNMSDKKLIYGKAVYAKHMLMAKNIDPDLYHKEKDIIADTEEASLSWYKYFRNQVKEET